MTWRLLYVRPAWERRVKDDMVRAGMTVWLPMQQGYRNPPPPSPFKRGQMRLAPKPGPKRTFERPLLPRYIFAELTDDQLAMVADIDGVDRVVGRDRGMAAQIELVEFIDRIRTAEADGLFDSTRPPEKTDKALLVPGQAVRFKRGHLAGIEGEIARCGSRRRVEVMFTYLGIDRRDTTALDNLVFVDRKAA